ncbi:polysaccharide transport protein [Lysinibacillus mangiferihumi]|uniref:Polysaccharide transport protein n=1 Tax=Lysinibacillus mangiferihumi TaxID=1130819 RepID=A0A4U2ZBC4_9BACI|nr:polysaccharide transport protein [Lysinibacillus mangiferihumi]TKI71687.1 polysaccharide transport protein [Lysinibacillus mangiferihumi]
MRTRKILLNLFSNVVLQVVTAVINFILPRLFMTTYGSATNGLVTSIKQFLGYLKIVEAGIGSASVAALYKPLAMNDKQQINGILSATHYFYRRSGMVFVVLVALLAMFYPLLVKEDVSPLTAFYMVLILGISGVWEYFLIGKYYVLLTADQKSYIVFRIQTGLLVVSTMLSLTLLTLGFSIIIVVGSSSILLLLDILFLKVYVQKKYPYFNSKVTPNTPAIKKRWDALIHQIASLVVFNTPFMLITVFLGLAEVSVFTVYNMVFNAVTLFISAFSGAMLAAFGDILVKEEKEALQRHFHHFECIFFAVVAFGYTCTALLILPFITIYTAGVEDANYIRPWLAALFVIVGIANAIRIPANTLVNSAGHFKETKNRAIIEAAINLSVSFVLVQFFGAEGILIGGLCSYAYRTCDLILYTSKEILKTSVRITVKKIVLNCVLAFIAASPFLFLIELHIVSAKAWFLAAICISLWTILVVVMGNLLFQPTTMREILLHLKRVIFND